MTAYPERPRILPPVPVDWYGPEDAPQPPDYDPERGDLLNGYRPPKVYAKPATHRHDWVHVPERRHACCAAGCDATEQCDCAPLDNPSPTP